MKLFRQIEITTEEPESIGVYPFSFLQSVIKIGDNYCGVLQLDDYISENIKQELNSLRQHVEAIPNTARVVEEYDKIKQDIVIPQEMKALFEALESLSNKLA